MARSLLAWSRVAAALAMAASARAQEPPRHAPAPTSVAAPMPAQVPSDRELEVLRLLRRALADEPLHRHYEWRRGRRGKWFCGNDPLSPEWLQPPFEALFRAYGLDVVRNVPIQAAGVAVQLDGRDPKRRLGWKLLSPSQSDQEKALEPEEVEPLQRAGETVLLAHAPRKSDSYVRLLLAAVDWLDAHDDGLDVDTTALSMRRVRSAPVAMPPGAVVVKPADTNGVVTIRVTEETKWRIASNQLVWQEPAAANTPAANAPAPLAGPQLANRAIPTLVQLELADLDHATLVCRLQQDDPATGVHEHGCGNRATFVMPSSFDRSRPFTIEVRLLPGTYEWRPWLHVGLP